MIKHKTFRHECLGSKKDIKSESESEIFVPNTELCPSSTELTMNYYDVIK